MIGSESTSSNKYEPPCKSRPRFTFLDNITLSFILTKFTNEKSDKKIMIKYIMNNLSFEKYNTKYNYFFVSGLFIKPCTVD